MNIFFYLNLKVTQGIDKAYKCIYSRYDEGFFLTNFMCVCVCVCLPLLFLGMEVRHER